MASLVLLNDDGTVFRKLSLVSLPDDYQVPEGKLVSWQMFFERSSMDVSDALRGPKVPLLSYFYLGSAWAEMKRNVWERASGHDLMRYGVGNYTLTIQGKSAKDVVALRDMVLQYIRAGNKWEVRNDFSPKVSIWRKLISSFSR